VNGTLTFEAGETEKTFEVPVLDDGTGPPNKTVDLSLRNPGGGATLGRDHATLWIVQN
jgi:hypothetical protein